jgi:hypothetical protein
MSQRLQVATTATRGAADRFVAALPFFVCLPLVGFTTSTTAQADTPTPGFVLNALPYPGAGLVTTLANGEFLAFDGQVLSRHDSSGALLQTLTTLPNFVFASFLVVDPTESFAIFGESSNQEILKIDIATGAILLTDNLTFSFDAVFLDADTVLISAAVCGFCGDNNFYLYESNDGSMQEIAQVSGPSGPLALDAAGNLYYAQQSGLFPAPAGSTSILRFDAALLDGSVYLGDSDATVISTGFDAGGDLVCDPATGALYLAESSFSTGNSFLFEVKSTRGSSNLVATSGAFTSIGGLEFVSGAAPAAFAPYQPAFGGTLRYTTTDFFSFSDRYEVRPARTELALSGVGVTGAGPFDLDLTGGPAGGVAYTIYGLQSLLAPTEIGYVTGVTAPLFTRLDLFTFVYGPILALDGNGEATLGFTNPGTWQGTAAVQALIVDPSLGIVGTSTLALL